MKRVCVWVVAWTASWALVLLAVLGDSQAGETLIEPILKYPDRRLRLPCLKEQLALHRSLCPDVWPDGIPQLIQNLYDTMKAARGVGLAGNQLGWSLRIAVVEIDGVRYDLINPEIVDMQGCVVSNEGCLSLPGIRADVPRAATVTVCYEAIDGEKKTLTAEGLLSIALQHETDHLDGKLFIDHLSSLKRGLLLRKYRKLLRQTA